MRTIVVGQGAMGLLWYHHLTQSASVSSLSLLASTQHNLTNDSYQFINSDGKVYQGKVNYAHKKQIEEADVIFFCLKSFQISAAIEQIAHLIQTNTAIILAHNGMGTLTELPEAFINQHNIYALLTTHGCLRNAPLNITHTGFGTTDIGLISGNNDTFEQQSLTRLLDYALPTVTWHQDIDKKQWLKLAINCVINPLTAIHDINNGKICNETFIKQIEDILTEVVLIAKSEGILFDLAVLIKTVQQVATATAKNCSSMRCDVLAHKQTEINYINGYIHRLGIKYNIATPENTQLWQAVLRQSQDNQ